MVVGWDVALKIVIDGVGNVALQTAPDNSSVFETALAGSTRPFVMGGNQSSQTPSDALCFAIRSTSAMKVASWGRQMSSDVVINFLRVVRIHFEPRKCQISLGTRVASISTP